MGHHVVGHDDVRPRALRTQPDGQLVAEERLEGRDAARACVRGGPGCGLDPEHRHPGRDGVLEEVPVVARDLDDQAVGAEAAVGDQPVDVQARVLDELVGERRVVRVRGAEDDLGGQDVGQLDEGARLAHPDPQREPRLGLPEVARFEQGIGHGRQPEVEERARSRRPAGAAAQDGRRLDERRPGWPGAAGPRVSSGFGGGSTDVGHARDSRAVRPVRRPSDARAECPMRCPEAPEAAATGGTAGRGPGPRGGRSTLSCGHGGPRPRAPSRRRTGRSTAARSAA